MRSPDASRRRPVLAVLAGLIVLHVGLPSAARGPVGGRDADYQMAVSQAYKRYQADRSGTIPDTVPRLAQVSPQLYGLVLVRVDGKVWQAGDSRTPFVISAAAAPFTAALLLEQGGSVPDDPLGPDGSLLTLSLVKPQRDGDAKWREVLGNLGAFAGRELSLDQGMYKSASAATHAVQQAARQLADEGRLQDDAESTATLWVKQGAVTLTAHDLAVMAATLANGGMNPVNGRKVVKPEVARNLQDLIVANGVQKVGMAAVAGKAGCIIAIVPGRFGLATYSPPLDASGASVRGKRAIKYLSQALQVDIPGR
jgi:glutaminase